MKKNLFSLFLLGLSATTQLVADSSLLGGAQELQIIVNNRILAKVNGKAISVMDLMKKMDMLFYRQFPQYASSVQARYQFYLANWKYFLSEIIDKELILADAEENNVTVSNGDIRQEIETMFGPNIIENLDKIGLTFDEASKMVVADITIRRMVYFRVQSKALNQVTPQAIRKYYDEVAKENIRDNEWIYTVITIRHRENAKAAEMASRVKQLLIEEKVPLSELIEKLKSSTPESSKPASVTLSEEFHTKEKELSEGFKNILVTLKPNSYSDSIVQKSRADNSTLYRIFYLKEMVPGGVIPFNELDAKIKEKLLDDAIAKETEAYISKLRQHFDVQENQLKEMLSSDFQPFLLK